MKKQVLVCDLIKHGKKVHPYLVLRTKHPVHMIEGGRYLTEDDRQFDPAGDMGWFGLNQKEYEYFKSHQEMVEIDE